MLRSLLRNTLRSTLKVTEKNMHEVTRTELRRLSVLIPAYIARELGIRERQKLVVHSSGDKIITEDWKE